MESLTDQVKELEHTQQSICCRVRDYLRDIAKSKGSNDIAFELSFIWPPLIGTHVTDSKFLSLTRMHVDDEKPTDPSDTTDVTFYTKRGSIINIDNFLMAPIQLLKLINAIDEIGEPIFFDRDSDMDDENLTIKELTIIRNDILGELPIRCNRLAQSYAKKDLFEQATLLTHLSETIKELDALDNKQSL